jgi:hypothetical protein
MSDFGNRVINGVDYGFIAASQALQDSVGVRSLQDGSQSHDSNVSLVPVLAANLCLDEVEYWLHDIVTQYLSEVVQSASS